MDSLKIFFIRNRITLFFLVLFVGVLFAFSEFEINDKFFYATLGALITLYIGITRYHLNNDKVFMELFNEFNSRYDDETNELFNSLRDGLRDYEPKEDRLRVIDYLNLCAEEYMWYKKGRIPKDVWAAWEVGIIKNLILNNVYDVFDDEKNLSGESYYGFMEYISPILDKQRQSYLHIEEKHDLQTIPSESNDKMKASIKI
ncbi:MAG: hypothetical protein WD016_10615 [Balneolaceae bacterium]